MNGAEEREAADLLAVAERDRRPIGRLSRRYNGMTVDNAYAVQLLNVARRVNEGGEVLGHKIGLTSKVMQEQFGIDVPDYGHLLDDMLEPSGTEIAVDRFIAPRIEVELGFYLKQRLEGPGVTVDRARAALDSGVACLEIIDSRIRNWDIGLPDTIADNGSSAAAVLSDKRVPVDRFDPAAVPAALEVDGTVVHRGSTADVLGDPVKVVAWLANTLAVHDIGLEPGHLIMTGSCTAAVAVAPGVRVMGRMDGFGEVSVSFC